jgi:hypothetical protein
MEINRRSAEEQHDWAARMVLAVGTHLVKLMLPDICAALLASGLESFWAALQ